MGVIFGVVALFVLIYVAISIFVFVGSVAIVFSIVLGGFYLLGQTKFGQEIIGFLEIFFITNVFAIRYLLIVVCCFFAVKKFLKFMFDR